MKKKRFTEVQIVNILKAYEAGTSAMELSRKHGIGESTIYAWKAKYAGMSASDLKRLRQLEEENNRLKKDVRHLEPRS